MDFNREINGIRLGVIANDSRISAAALMKRFALDGETCGTWFRIEPSCWRIVVDVRDVPASEKLDLTGTSKSLRASLGRSRAVCDAVSALPILVPIGGGYGAAYAELTRAIDPRIPRLTLSSVESLGRSKMRGVGIVIAVGMSLLEADTRSFITELLEDKLPDLQKIIAL